MITEENFLDFKCPYCGELNSFPLDCAGLVRECLNCMESLIVPEAGGAVGQKLPLPITTPRLVLRRLDAGDLKDLLEFMFEEEEEALRWLENDGKVRLTTSDQTFSLGVETKDGGKGRIIGCLGLKFTDRGFLEAEISASGNQNVQDKHLPLEAVKAALVFCFKSLKLHRVIARCDSKDAAGCQLFEQAGMRREGEFVKCYRVGGEWLSMVWFAMLDEEYPAG
jgi:RimJ/RimL family protein N-acetyltransferase